MTEMSFLDHLQELRTRLIVCIIALFIAAAVAWPLTPIVQRFIQRPLMEPSVLQDLKYSVATWAQKHYPVLSQDIGLKPTPPRVTPHRLNYMAPLEPFFVQMKISLITGFALAFPVILYEIWLFFRPGPLSQGKKIRLFFSALRFGGLHSGGHVLSIYGVAA